VSSVYGVGCDIIDVRRVTRLYEKYRDNFVRRILTENEFSIAQRRFSNNNAMLLFLAKRYAAKEAFAKAVGVGIGDVVGFQNVEVANNANGKPYFRFFPNLLLEVGRVHLSLSDEPPFIIAYVVVETK
jgi:holo-[acyl-carrier protein] synthase